MLLAACRTRDDRGSGCRDRSSGGSGFRAADDVPWKESTARSWNHSWICNFKNTDESDNLSLTKGELLLCIPSSSARIRVWTGSSSASCGREIIAKQVYPFSCH